MELAMTIETDTATEPKATQLTIDQRIIEAALMHLTYGDIAKAIEVLQRATHRQGIKWNLE